MLKCAQSLKYQLEDHRNMIAMKDGQMKAMEQRLLTRYNSDLFDPFPDDQSSLTSLESSDSKTIRDHNNRNNSLWVTRCTDSSWRHHWRHHHQAEMTCRRLFRPGKESKKKIICMIRMGINLLRNLKDRLRLGKIRIRQRMGRNIVLKKLIFDERIKFLILLGIEIPGETNITHWEQMQ